MEMKAMGIPVLASDRGGASELTNDKNFIFKAGDTKSFIDAISILIEIDKKNYYKFSAILKNNKIHNNELCYIYNKVD